jgi:hypothetical protein
MIGWVSDCCPASAVWLQGCGVLDPPYLNYAQKNNHSLSMTLSKYHDMVLHLIDGRIIFGLFAHVI